MSVFIVAEIGINHNGDINVAKQLIDGAKYAGCDAVKFQKRIPGFAQRKPLGDNTTRAKRRIGIWKTRV